MTMTTPQAVAERGWHYGWIVVGVTFLTLLTTAGAMSMPGLLLVPLQREFGWSTATISTALSLRMAVFGLMAPFAAAFMMRFGLRRMMMLAVTITAIGVGLTAFASQSWQLTLLWGLIVGGGTGLTALVLGATVANVWFVQRRGLVVGLMTASSASGRAAVPAGVRPHQRCVRLAAGGVHGRGVAGVPDSIIALLMRNRPSDIGLKAYRLKPGSEGPLQSRSTVNPIVASFQALSSAVRTRDFWLLSFGFLVCGSSTNGLIGTHLIAACSDAGIAALMAAGLLALMEARSICSAR